MKRLGKAILDLVFPQACLTCASPPEPDSPFCGLCLAGISHTPALVCSRCGGPLPQEGLTLCGQCRKDPPPYDHALALAMHDGPLADSVRGFKYQGNLRQGAGLGRFLAARAPDEYLAGLNLAAPVPLHPRRLFKRGYNQSLELMRPLVRQRGLELVPELLRRVRHTRPQTGLSREERRANVAGAFAPGGRAARLAPGAGVLLVDDVFTTGSTVAECARVLKGMGAGKVAVLTLTRAI